MPEPSPAPPRRDAAARIAIPAALLLAVFLAYFRVGGHPFVLLDDEAYLTDNPVVKQGLSADGIRWAFTTFHAGNWHPLAWLSHMADVSLFGMDPGAHHLVNVLLHGLDAVLLFRFLFLSTGSRWRSAAVAALFALHPLHVESVAWASERKDLLCAFFSFLALLAWRRYAERPAAAPYLFALLSCAAALLSKPMAVTMPFVLLLADFWPLGRMVPTAGDGGGRRRFVRLAAEKAPFLALAAASSIVTLAAQGSWGFVSESVPFPLRAANALNSWAGYLLKAAWPHPLSVHYPHAGEWAGGLPAWRFAACAAGLLAATGLSLRRFRDRPHLAAGWLWYLGTLVPVIGLVQVGTQGMADRYTYFPLVGIFVMAAWSIPEPREGRGRAILGAGAAALLAVLAILSYRQAGAWGSSERLFRNALEADPSNAFALDGLGTVRSREGRTEEAEALFRQAIRLAPGSLQPHSNLSTVLLREGRTAEAVSEAEAALRISPGYPAARLNLASALSSGGREAEALPQYEAVVRSTPGSAAARIGLGACLAALGRSAEAEAEFREAARIDPSNPQPRNNLAVLLLQAGKSGEAAALFRDVLRDHPGNGFATQRLLELEGKR